jgi:TetR/AcrR family transcriptional regulator, copper-responsive repressor
MAKVGRPREFDRDSALEGAVMAFWEKGFESTSIAELTRRLGIAGPSLYAAFGDKRALYLEALDLYYGHQVEFLDQTLSVPGPRREAIAAMLLGMVRLYTTPGMPVGCMVNTGEVPTGERALYARLIELRASTFERIRREIRAADEAGELPEAVGPDVMAGVIWTTVLGMAARSRDGADGDELELTARSIMAVWPPAP